MTQHQPDAPETATDAAPPDLADLSLRALVSGIAGRDQADLARFYDATSARLYALALRIVGNAAAAEEVVADVYFQVWQQAGRYDPQRAKVLAWLHMICRSRALDYLRRQVDALGGEAAEAALGQLESDTPSPFDAMLGLQAGSLLHCALAAMDSRQRQLVTLAFFRDMSHAEIAKHTQMPLGTVKTLLRRSLQQLRQQLPTV